MTQKKPFAFTISLVFWIYLTLITSFSGNVLASPFAEYAVIIVIDGCRPEYFELAPLLHVKELAERGVTYDRAWVGQIPTNTPASHATLGTGAFPSGHHVVGFKWKNPKTGDNVYPCTTENIRRGLLVNVLSNAGVPSVFHLYKKAYPKGRTLAISSVKPYAALTMGNVGADYILFTPSSKKAKIWGEEGVEKGMVRLFESLPGYEVEQEILDQINHKIKPYKYTGDLDTWVVEVFLAIFEQEMPTFTMMNLPETDEMGHVCGGMTSPEIMMPVIKNVDVQIGRIIDAFKTAGIFEKTLFVVTADHGMVTNAYNVSVSSYIKAFLRPRDFPQLGITTPFIWLRNSAQSKDVAERIANMEPPGIGGIFHKNQENKQPCYHRTPEDNHDSMYEECWNYLLKTIACANSPDILLRLRENSIIGRKFPVNSHGKHYQGTWFAQHIPLIISGPGVKSGVHSDLPARIVDIPPTVLTLMGVAPNAMDGMVLADALINPLPEQVKTQRGISGRLTEYQQTLIQQSKKDLSTIPVIRQVSILGSPWFYNVLVCIGFILLSVIIKKMKYVSKGKKIKVFLAGVFLFMCFQIFFFFLMTKMMEL